MIWIKRFSIYDLFQKDGKIAIRLFITKLRLATIRCSIICCCCCCVLIKRKVLFGFQILSVVGNFFLDAVLHPRQLLLRRLVMKIKIVLNISNAIIVPYITESFITQVIKYFGTFFNSIWRDAIPFSKKEKQS